MKGFQLLFMIGGALLAVSCIGDSFFHLSDTIVTSFALAAAIAMWTAIRLQKSEKQEEIKASRFLESPKRRFALLSVAALVGLVIGFFSLRSAHPGQSVTVHVAISLFSFVVCMTILYQKIFRQSAANPEKREPQE